MPFRFVHTADIHLDSPLKSLAMRDADLAALVQTATRQTFRNIINLCLEENVDALLIAGDLYDGDQTSMKTAAFLGAELRRLTDAGIHVCLIRGNHDAKSGITKRLSLPDLVQTYSTRTAEVLDLPEKRVAIHGTSFPDRHVPESLLPRFAKPLPDRFNIGMLHTSPDGAEGHDVYAPAATAELAAHGFDYWALGHIHKRQVYRDHPAIVMPGIPQGRHVNEAGPKSVTLAQVDDGGTLTLDERFLSVAEFAQTPVDLSGIEEWGEAQDAINVALDAASAAKKSNHLITRLLISGTTPLAWRLRRDAELLEEQARHLAADTWIESLEINCTAPIARMDTASGAIPELAALMQEIALKPEFQREARLALDDLLKALPLAARDAFGADETAMAAIATTLGEAGAQDVLARLAAPASVED